MKKKVEKNRKLKNLKSWKIKVEKIKLRFDKLKKLKTIVSNENLKRKLQFKKSRKVVCLHIPMGDKPTQQTQLFSLL